MATEAQYEVLSDALNRVLLAGDFETTADPRGYIRKEQMLLDACIQAGMLRDHPAPREWASIMVGYWLSGPVTGLWAGSGYARNYALAIAA